MLTFMDRFQMLPRTLCNSPWLRFARQAAFPHSAKRRLGVGLPEGGLPLEALGATGLQIGDPRHGALRFDFPLKPFLFPNRISGHFRFTQSDLSEPAGIRALWQFQRIPTSGGKNRNETSPYFFWHCELEFLMGAGARNPGAGIGK